MVAIQRPISDTFPRIFLHHILTDACDRARRACASTWVIVFGALSCFPSANADDGNRLFYPLLEQSVAAIDDNFIYNQSLKQQIGYSVANETGWFYINEWIQRGRDIRAGATKEQCLANLTWALMTLSASKTAEARGATGALSLLPTAGALVGAPAAEMWVIFKLVPLAGVLSLFLGLGGRITPLNPSDYNLQEGFRYGGLMPTYENALHAMEMSRADAASRQLTSPSAIMIESPLAAQLMETEQQFAQRVSSRANFLQGPQSYNIIWAGIIAQFCLVGAILIVLGYAQAGSVLSWWCKSWAWMYFWYFMVVVSSIMDCWTASPFSEDHVLRVSKAPSGVTFGHGTPNVLDDSRQSLLFRINSGFNVRTRIDLPRLTTTASSCFYVIISVQNTTAIQALFRVIAQGCSVSVFAFGTALFASSTLMSISVALMVLTVVLTAGVLGRVIAMWIVNIMNKRSPIILHKIVRDRETAERYMWEIFSEKELLVEYKDLVLLEGFVIEQRSWWKRLSSYVGLLAKARNLQELAQKFRDFGPSTRYVSDWGGFESQPLTPATSVGNLPQTNPMMARPPQVRRKPTSMSPILSLPALEYV